MTEAIQPKNHPFRFLLYIEWGLLAVASINILNGSPPRGHHKLLLGWEHSPLAGISLLLLFGLMGLYLPAGKLPKVGHTVGQILLILLMSAAVLEGGRIIPVVYLVLVIRGCLMFGLAGRLTLTALSFISFLTGLQLRLQFLSGAGRRLPPQARRRLEGLILGFQLDFVVLFGLALLLVVLLVNALLIERESQRRLQRANLALQQSAQEIEKLAMDQERNRIARDIHDALGHSLSALNIQLESALKLWKAEPERSHRFLAQAKQLGTQSLQEVRHSVAAVRQDPLSGKTLEEAIAQLLQDIQNSLDAQDLPLPPKVTSKVHLTQSLPANIQAILYRIAQAGLTNSVRHASATLIHLSLTDSAQSVAMTIEDNGVGFKLAQAQTGFGLQSMRERAETVEGTFHISSYTEADRHAGYRVGHKKEGYRKEDRRKKDHRKESQTNPKEKTKTTGTRIDVTLPLQRIGKGPLENRRA